MLFGQKTMYPDLIIFNSGTDLEFAECEVCGHEINPPRNSGRKLIYIYPTTCPNCRTKVHAIKAEDKR